MEPFRYKDIVCWIWHEYFDWINVTGAEKMRSLFVWNLQSKSEFGIDYKRFQIGEKFMGVQNIPKGLHFMFYKHHSEHALRMGSFIMVEEDTILTKSWDMKEELLMNGFPKNVDEANFKGKDSIKD